MGAAIKTWSIKTNHHQRDAHLRSPAFFDVDTYPRLTYKLNSYRMTGEDYTATGGLSLHGITKETTLVGSLIGLTKDPTGNIRAGIVAEGTINRRDFNVNFNDAQNNGGFIVGDGTIIKLNPECNKAESISR